MAKKNNSRKKNKKTVAPPKVEEISEEELENLLTRVKSSEFPEENKEFIIHCIENALWFPHILQKRNISLSRLRKMLFGESYGKPKPGIEIPSTGESSNNDIEPLPVTTTGAIEAEVNSDKDNVESGDNGHTTESEKKTGSGHGRMPHTAYENYKAVTLTIEGLQTGDGCPKDCGGKLYPFEPNNPRVLVRVQGQNFAEVYKYTVERLRCNLCDYLVQATIPDEVGTDKYNASFKSWLVLQKYYVAVPFYRQESFQRLLKFPLPASTQWGLVEQAAGACYGVFNELTFIAANGEVIHNDDTNVRIQEVIAEIKANPEMARKGMFTTGMVAQSGEHKIALFFNGTNHAGENLETLLEKRESDKPSITQMCDALSCNVPKKIKTIVCNCLSHGFRKFDELVDYFPMPCITIMKLLSRVYENDDKTKGLSKEERLNYHKKHSTPAMDTLWRYMEALFEERLVEPNSELGGAVRYMKKHWKKLTRFLSVAGAPLCNNVVERALKLAIRNRKAALFYRTRYSAQIGGMLTSIIYTCQLANVNPHDYLTTLQEQAAQVQLNPAKWLPWNYEASLEASVALSNLVGEVDAASPVAVPLVEADLAAE